MMSIVIVLAEGHHACDGVEKGSGRITDVLLGPGKVLCAVVMFGRGRATRTRPLADDLDELRNAESGPARKGDFKTIEMVAVVAAL